MVQHDGSWEYYSKSNNQKRWHLLWVNLHELFGETEESKIPEPRCRWVQAGAGSCGQRQTVFHGEFPSDKMELFWRWVVEIFVWQHEYLAEWHTSKWLNGYGEMAQLGTACHTNMRNWLRVSIKKVHGQRDGSVGKSTCCQDWWSEFNPLDTQSGRRELSPTGCPLSSTSSLLLMQLWYRFGGGVYTMHTLSMCSHVSLSQTLLLPIFQSNSAPLTIKANHALLPVMLCPTALWCLSMPLVFPVCVTWGKACRPL